MSKLNYRDVDTLISNYIKVAVDVHGYDYVAGSLSSMLGIAISELNPKKQKFSVDHLLAMTKLLQERQEQGIKSAPLL